jgi:hypothetical protein
LAKVLKRRVFERCDASAPRVAALPWTAVFRRAFERNRGRFFFGYFLLLKQKKVTHREVNSLLSGLTAGEKMITETKQSRPSGQKTI